jgi:hypothetical protein
MKKPNKPYIFDGYLRINRYHHEGALVYLYENLVDIQKDPQQCSDFLNTVKMEAIDSDAIVHILNALSPNKENIPNWNHFETKAHQRLTKLVGEEKAKDLMKVTL